MRIQVSCPVCLSFAVSRSASPEEIQRIFEAKVATLITHERSSTARCREGHLFGVGITESAYSLVFERGLQRFVDRDWRDAVLDAYTALDMYTPTVPIRARYDRERNLVPSDIRRLRKEMKFTASDANKALGAAFAVASVVSGREPPKFDSKLAQLRNRAVHAGEYPSEEDAEWALLEVERIVIELESMLDEGGRDREPSFRLAVQIADFPFVSLDVDGSTTVGIQGVLSGSTIPRETVHRRLARYRNGELREVSLY